MGQELQLCTCRAVASGTCSELTVVVYFAISVLVCTKKSGGPEQKGILRTAVSIHIFNVVS